MARLVRAENQYIPSMHTNSIPALVINLKRSADRLAFQQAQLADLGIVMERLDATSMEQLESDRYEALANGWERKLRPAEVACFLSHQSAWKHVAKSGHAHLILEDDALLSQHLPGLLTALASNPVQAELITLETRSRKKLLGQGEHRVSAGFSLRKLYQDRTGAAAYILFPAGAAKLLQKSRSTAPGLADAFISSCYALNAWQVVTAAAIQLDQCEAYGLAFDNPFASTITPVGSQRPNVDGMLSKLKFKVRRWRSQWSMGLRQLSVLGKARREFVTIKTDDFSLPPGYGGVKSEVQHPFGQ